MNRLEKLTRAVVIALILFILRIRWEFSITGSTDIEEYWLRTTETHLPGGDRKFERVAHSWEAMGGL